MSFSLLKKKNEENPSVCNNLDEPGGHYVKYDNSEKQKQILHKLTDR